MDILKAYQAKKNYQRTIHTISYDVLFFKTCFPDRTKAAIKHKGLPSSYKDVRKGLKIEESY